MLNISIFLILSKILLHKTETKPVEAPSLTSRSLLLLATIINYKQLSFIP